MTYDPTTANIDVSNLATKSDLLAKANASSVGGLATQVNSKASQVALDAVAASMPVAASSSPPAVADTSTAGSASPYARADHTHASKVRKIRAQTAVDGSLVWTFEPPFAPGVKPIVLAVAETAAGVTDVINAQVVDQPTNTGCKILANRTQRSVVALLGLTILSVPSASGVIWVHAIAVEP